MKSVSNCSEKKRKVLFSYAYFLTFPFKKLYHSLNSKNKKEILFRAMSKTYCYHIVFLKFFKNDCILVNSSTHYVVCKRDRIASKKICISNQKPSYIPMEPFLQQSCHRHVQEYISWIMNRRQPGKKHNGHDASLPDSSAW